MAVFVDFGPKAYAYAETIRSRGGDELMDFVGSPFYKRVQAGFAEDGVFCITLIGHLDTAPLQQSTGLSFTPLQMAVAELPPALRWSTSTVLLYKYCITEDTKSADYIKLFDGIDEQLQRATGLSITVAGRQMPIRVRLAVVVSDMGAKGKILGMNGHQGYYGCNMCEDPGIHEGRHLYVNSALCRLRTAGSYKRGYSAFRLTRRSRLGFEVVILVDYYCLTSDSWLIRCFGGSFSSNFRLVGRAFPRACTISSQCASPSIVCMLQTWAWSESGSRRALWEISKS